MKWRGRRTSRNIEDRRGSNGGFFGGSGPRIRIGGSRRGGMRGGGAKLGGLGAIIVVVIALIFGGDLSSLLGPGGGDYTAPEARGPNTIGDPSEEFVAVVLADTEEVWTALFRQYGETYQPPTLVLFEQSTPTACGQGNAATGPFYCPADRKVYLDLSFFRVLESRLGAGGDFARAYVIAHETAHHVQNILGILPNANPERARVSEARANEISVMIELQADCLSGVWARQAEARFGALEPGDIEEALNAAAMIGDDTLQRRSGGTVMPDSFTHGTSEQRVRWFRLGYDSGSMDVCDTFSARRL